MCIMKTLEDANSNVPTLCALSNHYNMMECIVEQSLHLGVEDILNARSCRFMRIICITIYHLF